MLPFLLTPYLKKVLWGGSALAPFKGLPAHLDHIGESWEVSAMPGCESVVASGPYEGMTLLELCRLHGKELMGKAVYESTGGEFPLLVKFIDAADDLSVQVHPGDELARRRHGCAGKCEMWYILHSHPGTRLGAGLREPLTPEDFERRVSDGTFGDAIEWYETSPGDIFYLPAGRVHAIGAGNMLLEVQQPSDITYRIYDYNRRDDAGNLRPLHIDHARDAIDFSTADTYRVSADGDTLLRSEHFTVQRIDVVTDKPYDLHRECFTALMSIAGEATVATADGSCSLTLQCGHSMIVPADTAVVISGTATIITAIP